MENFWPVNLLSEHDSGDADWSLFEAQAAAISDATRGLVQGELRRHVMPIGRASSIFIWPTGQRVKGYEFMAIRAEQEGFPLVLEVYHLGDSHRISRARDAAELKRALHKIFDNDATRRIVRLLANEASQAQAVRIDVGRAEVEQPEAEAASGTTTTTSRPDDSASRPIAVGGLPYATQLIPLAAICAQLGDKTTQHGVKQLLLRWFWSGVLGELYGGANETRFAMDMQDVVAWAAGGAEPRSVRDANFAPTRLLSLQSRLAAAYKGLAALLMKHGGRDFASGTPIDLNTYFNNAIDIHHIFPRVWCEKQKLPREKWNSVINKAPLAASTNPRRWRCFSLRSLEATARWSRRLTARSTCRMRLSQVVLMACQGLAIVGRIDSETAQTFALLIFGQA